MQKIIETFTKKNTFFILDFDGTLTTGSCASSFSLFRRSGVLGADFEAKSQELFEFYHPFEIDHTLTQEARGKLMYEWHHGAFEILQKLKFTKEQFEKVLDFHHLIHFREGMKEFLQTTHILEIPVIIFSAGIEQVIERFFESNTMLLPNMHIVSNRLLFNTKGIFTGIDEKNFMYPTEKTWDKVSEQVKQKVEGRDYIILGGDMVDDVTMAPLETHRSVFQIGFVNNQTVESKAGYESVFDIVITSDESDTGVMEMVIDAVCREQ